jgi:hypothetical protein
MKQSRLQDDVIHSQEMGSPVGICPWQTLHGPPDMDRGLNPDGLIIAHNTSVSSPQNTAHETCKLFQLVNLSKDAQSDQASLVG